ncbi:MAG: 50S ribosomal protein L4 [Deltaproteobacteria bacterium]|nr:50S ribosomal protein L4 [Deltaproteobacteria bacterium]
MPTMNVLNTQAQVVGEIELSDDVFAAEVKPFLHWEVVRNQLANRRQGTHSTKTRTTVHGTTRKTYKQKGSGNARHGSRKSPIFVHGGIAHGPHPRDYSYSTPKKVRRAALRSALSLRYANGELVVVDAFGMGAPKTKEAAATLARLGASNALVVTRHEESHLHLSIRNLPTAKYIRAEGVNVFDVLKYDRLVLSVDAAKALEERLG